MTENSAERSGKNLKVNNEESLLIPKLRFNGFNDEWIETTLGDVVKEFINGQTPSRNHPEFWEGNIPWVSSGELNYNIITNTNEKITETGKQSANLQLLPKGTLLIAITGLEAAGTRGSCAILGIEATTNQSCMALIPDTKKITRDFLYNWYLKIGEKYGIKYTQGTKQQSYNIELLKKLPIRLPKTIEEQNSLTDLLTLMDKRIEFMEKKYDTYSKMRKFFIIKIFNNLQNKDNKIEFTTLGQISDIKMGFTPSTKKIEYWDGSNKWLSIADLKTKYVKDTHKKITNEAIKNRQIIKKGSLVMSFKLTIGKLAILQDDMYSNEAICNFSWKSKIDTEYMYYYLNSIRIEKYGAIAAKGVTLNKEILKTIPIKLINYEKQKEISQFLRNMDFKLDLLKKEIIVNKEYKRSLLSKMFC